MAIGLRIIEPSCSGIFFFFFLISPPPLPQQVGFEPIYDILSILISYERRKCHFSWRTLACFIVQLFYKKWCLESCHNQMGFLRISFDGFSSAWVHSRTTLISSLFRWEDKTDLPCIQKRLEKGLSTRNFKNNLAHVHPIYLLRAHAR